MIFLGVGFRRFSVKKIFDAKGVLFIRLQFF
jgi:hypothetical protein